MAPVHAASPVHGGCAAFGHELDAEYDVVVERVDRVVGAAVQRKRCTSDRPEDRGVLVRDLRRGCQGKPVSGQKGGLAVGFFVGDCSKAMGRSLQLSSSSVRCLAD